tara:strand:+ start:176 stop:280 length:105 start_codon:yes stop_codon:yes gene_type:complete
MYNDREITKGKRVAQAIKGIFYDIEFNEVGAILN